MANTCYDIFGSIGLVAQRHCNRELHKLRELNESYEFLR